MKSAKNWEILNKFIVHTSQFTVEKLITLLLENRGLKTKKDIEDFLHPKLEEVTIESLKIDKKQLAKAIKRVQQAIKKKEKIIIYGDYDVDGITGTAILWESLHTLGANVIPYIPHRIEEGYGLSVKGIENVILNTSEGSDSGKALRYTQEKQDTEQIQTARKTANKDSSVPKVHQNDKIGLIITVDNGIVANESVAFANAKGIDVIITDHHTLGTNLPEAYAIVHTTAVCGAAVGWIFSQELRKFYSSREHSESRSLEKFSTSSNNKFDDHLSLVALATVADLVPLTGANRTLLKFGLHVLKQTKRPGLLALFQEAQIEPETISVYTIGHVIAPRLNAMGRLESAMDSLRLLCTHNVSRAKELAQKLERTNKERQLLTASTVEHAKQQVISLSKETKILFIHHESYEEGVIGLVAGKLVETFYLPAIVLSKGEKISKASARSIAGFNIIEAIRKSSNLLINAGGHPMAAGFTVETEKLTLLQEALEQLADGAIDKTMLQRVLRIDAEIPLEIISKNLFEKIQELAPFGMGCPEPVFVSDVTVEEMRQIGMDGKHLKLEVRSANNELRIQAIAFGMGDYRAELKQGNTIKIAYTIDENTWNGKTSLQLKIKDIKC